MAIDINWADIIGTGTLADGGHMGDILSVARAHVDDSLDKGRLTQEQAGQIYTSMIPAAINGALQFTLDKQLKEAQIESSIDATNRANEESALTQVLTQENIDKVAAETVVTEQKIIGRKQSTITAG